MTAVNEISASEFASGGSEHQEQVALMVMLSLHATSIPEVNLLFAIPNGGARHIAVAMKLKAEGVKSGVPDLFLPVARGKYHGLFVEMKKRKGKLSSHQKQWIEVLTGQGYLCTVCFGRDEALNCIIDYLQS